MISSDSLNFIANIQKKIPYVYIVTEDNFHIGTHDSNNVQNIKMLVDYYLMVGAKKIFSLWTEGMWKSALPEYTAMIGRTDFERITI